MGQWENMRDAAKIATGAGLAVLLAWFAHGPVGKGAAFVDGLRQSAGIALAAQGITTLSADFSTHPLSRVATLNGAPDSASSSNAAAIVNAVPGVSFTRWANGPAANILLSDENDMVPHASIAPGNAVAPVSPPTVATAKPASPEVVSCQDGVNQAVRGRSLNFRSGSAWLNPESRRIIKDVAATLKSCKGMSVEVGGHTDGRGNEGVNKILSDERAKRVRDELIAQGATANAVTARGYGSGAPIRTGDTLNPANRRIAFTVTKGGA